MIKMVGLEKYLNYYPSQLSASMLQRVVIARAFAVHPELLLMDEPYGQLDISLRFKLEDELLNLWRELKTTVIFITHNVEEAVYLGQRVLVLTNKPTKIKEEIKIDLDYPRSISDGSFVAYRERITDLIKWW
jgi:sulfonate transport system ATP-binding protein